MRSSCSICFPIIAGDGIPTPPRNDPPESSNRRWEPVGVLGFVPDLRCRMWLGRAWLGMMGDGWRMVR